MGSPNWKVYDSAGAYQAACKETEAAAALVALYGSGSTIRDGHGSIVWREGQEDFPAGESYDRVAVLVAERALAARRAAYDKAHGPGAAAALLAR